MAALRVLKRVKRMGNQVSQLHTIWVDGGFDGEPFMQWVMDVCRWTRAGSAATEANAHATRVLKKRACSGANSGLASLVSTIEQRL